MPEVEFNRTHFIQLFVLILALPLQYLLTQTSTEVIRQYELKQVLTGIQSFGQKYFDIKSWINWCGQFLSAYRNGPTDETSEMVTKNDKSDEFGLSLEPRLTRPPTVKFRVGQVIKHKTRGFRGVIVGWDETVKAPAAWMEMMRPEDKPQWRNMPNYAVLVDTRDRLTPQVAYVVEENIEPVSKIRILHPLLDTYFEDFDGEKYLMRPWLRKVYPRD